MIRYSAILALFMNVFFSPQPLRAQCSGVCGDLNGNGILTLTGDWAILLKYIRTAEWTGGAPACGDVDGFAGINARDLQYMAPLFSFGGTLNCVPDTPAVPVANDGYFLHYNSLVPPGDSVVTLHFEVTIADRIRTLSVPMRIDVDGESAVFGEIDAGAADGYGWESFAIGDYRTAAVPPGGLMAGYSTVLSTSGVNPGRYPIGQAELLVTPAPVYRTIHVQLVENPPGDNAPMAIQRPSSTSPNMTSWAINPAPWIVDQTGDANNDRRITAADVIGLVGYVFKGAKPPYPVPAAGDVDCSGDVTSGDIIGLVNYVFRSGPPPCDVAANCTIALEQWTCP